jgi:hypothetical protein
MSALDAIYRVDAIPAKPTKVLACGYVECGGGMAANASVAVARLGGAQVHAIRRPPGHAHAQRGRSLLEGPAMTALGKTWRLRRLAGTWGRFTTRSPASARVAGSSADWSARRDSTFERSMCEQQLDRALEFGNLRALLFQFARLRR